MNELRVRQIVKNVAVGTAIEISGWVRTRRDYPEFSFIELNDGSCLRGLQVVANNDLANFEDVVRKLTTGASIQVSGVLIESPGKGQRVELQAKKIVLLGAAEDYPLQKKGKKAAPHSPDFLRSLAHLRARTKVISAAMRVRSMAAQAVHRFFHKHDFYYIHTPILTASDCEGAGEMFQVTTLDMEQPPQKDGQVDYEQDFFGRKTFLTVSGQLNAETAACALGRVYTFGPTFRAENSNTTRHVSEFWMIEPEMAFADLDANADLAALFVQDVIRQVMDEGAEDLAFFDTIRKFKKPSPFVDASGGSLLESLQKVVDTPFQRMTYTEAITHLEKAKVKFQYPVSWGVALQTEHERYLCEQLVNAPLIVTDYPASFKSFYMYLNDDQKTVRAMDVLVPRIGELIGGSQREDRYDVLVERIHHHKLDPQDYWWYLDLRKYGSVPHSGFGLGFERLVMYLTGLNNIRDVIQFPRTPKQVEF